MGAPSRRSRQSRSSGGWTCPSEDLLYRFSTSDAPRWQRALIQRHVDRCAACAARIDGWEAATAAYRDYVNGPPGMPARQTGLGSRDAARGVACHARRGDGWGDVGESLDDTERERVAVTRFHARLRREPLPAPPRAALAWSRQVLRPIGWRSIAAAVVIIAGGLFGFLPVQQTITADALVARAVANDRQCPCPRADRVTIAAGPRRGSARTLATAGASALPAARGLMSERGEHARELAERLREYAFDWQAPLSARPYQEWRAALAERTESYDWIASDRVRVSTHATSGRIERAELILRTSDYRPVGQTWLFSDGFAVELRLFEPAVPPVTSPVLPALNRVAAANEASAAMASRTVEEAEIALRISLERAGVVLTRRLTLRYNGDSANGSAGGESVERLTIAGRAPSRDVSRIAASARDVGGVRVDVRVEARRAAIALHTSGAADGREPGSAVLASALPRNAVSSGFEAWLDRTFGDSRARAAFVPTARQLSDELADAVAALDGLGGRFPTSAADGRVSARARDDVRWLTAAYYARVTASYERLEAHLAPLTGSVSRRVLSGTPPSPWRTTSAAITPALRELSAELTTLPSPASSMSADDFERTAGASLREKLVAVVPR